MAARPENVERGGQVDPVGVVDGDDVGHRSLELLRAARGGENGALGEHRMRAVERGAGRDHADGRTLALAESRAQLRERILRLLVDATRTLAALPRRAERARSDQ